MCRREWALPFFVDTGSAGSEIDAGLAEELHLRKVGKAQVAGGAGCIFRTRPVRMPAWSVAGIPLEGQTFGAVDDAGIYEASGAVGTIGSDVLARFGAVRNAKALGLKPNGQSYKERTFCSTSEVPGVESGEWSIAGQPLKPQPVPSTPLIRSVLADGLIGGRTFDQYGSVVIDYAGERLVLGAG
jgi:Aspartyl protease